VRSSSFGSGEARLVWILRLGRRTGLRVREEECAEGVEGFGEEGHGGIG
jgi:hypothetical protein